MLAMFSPPLQRRSLIAWRLRGKLVFVSYRHADSTDITGRVCDHLGRNYGARRIIRDIDSIPLGYSFREYIDDAIANSRAVLAVIGPDWPNAEWAAGEDPHDMVRHELSSALRQDIPIIPVLVRRARIPRASDLPPALKPIADLQATRVRSGRDFPQDIQRLIRGIDRRT